MIWSWKKKPKEDEEPLLGRDSFPMQPGEVGQQDPAKQKTDQNPEDNKDGQKPPYKRHWTRRHGWKLGVAAFVGCIATGPIGATYILWHLWRSEKDREAEAKYYKPPKQEPDDYYKKAWFREDPWKAAPFAVGCFLLAPILAFGLGVYMISKIREDEKKEQAIKMAGRRARRDTKLAQAQEGQGQGHAQAQHTGKQGISSKRPGAFPRQSAASPMTPPMSQTQKLHIGQRRGSSGA